MRERQRWMEREVLVLQERSQTRSEGETTVSVPELGIAGAYWVSERVVTEAKSGSIAFVRVTMRGSLSSSPSRTVDPKLGTGSAGVPFAVLLNS